MTIKPLLDRVVLKATEVEETTQSGILALAGAVGAALCGRMVWRLRPLESKQQP